MPERFGVVKQPVGGKTNGVFVRIPVVWKQNDSFKLVWHAVIIAHLVRADIANLNSNSVGGDAEISVIERTEAYGIKRYGKNKIHLVAKRLEKLEITQKTASALQNVLREPLLAQTQKNAKERPFLNSAVLAMLPALSLT